MSDETEEQKKLMRQIDISCVQAFHTMDEIDAMVELAKKYRLAAVFTLPAFSAHVAERLQDTREIHAGGVVSFPGGGDTTGQKKRQAKEQIGATIFMVTHDSYAASFCDRVIVLKDGEIHQEVKRTGTRREFMDELLDILRELGGDEDNE